MRLVQSTLVATIVVLFAISANAQNKVVVVPLGSSSTPDTPQEVMDKIIQVDGSGSGLDADLLDGREGTYYNDWNNLTNIPSGFSDGTDNDSGGTITGVSGGTGLTGSATSGPVTINADTNYLQRRVSNSCDPGSSIRAIGADGTVTCETDDNSGGDITSVGTSNGILGGASSGTVSLTADTSYLQRRVSSNCAAGSSIRVINADGTIECETVKPSATSYAAGANIFWLEPEVVMISVDSGECFLHWVNFFADNTSTDQQINVQCQIQENADQMWVLKALAGTYDTATCHARCLTW